MALSDFAVLLNHRTGYTVCTWNAQEWQTLFRVLPRFPGMYETLVTEAPRMADWVRQVYERWVAKRFGAHLCLKTHTIWPLATLPAWGLLNPPPPSAVLRGFMRPLDNTPQFYRPRQIDPVDWAVWALWIWGCPLSAIREASGMARPQEVECLSRVIKWLMAHRLDIVVWALSPDKSSMPEGKLSPGWYARNEAWIRGQQAIGAPYVPAPYRIRNNSLKENTWPSEMQISNPQQLAAPRRMRKGKRLTRREERCARVKIKAPWRLAPKEKKSD